MPTIKNRRATQAQWEALNPVLAAGEIGYEFGNNRHKIGNGLSVWSDLPYFIDENAVLELLPDAGSSGASIDDLILALDKTWSSMKTSEELAKKIDEAENVMAILTEDGVFTNPITGEIIEMQMPDGVNIKKYTLQLGLAMLYDMVDRVTPRVIETKTLIPGPITNGVSPIKHAFTRNPDDIGLNNISFITVSLDTPSTTETIRYKLYSNGSTSSEFTIPMGGTEVQHNDPSYAARPSWSLSSLENDKLHVEILEAGSGASGLTVRAVRKD